MPAVITESPYRPVPIDPPRKRWTRQELTALESSGTWDHQHLELVDGELIAIPLKTPRYSYSVTTSRNWLSQVFGPDYVLQGASINVAPEDNPTSLPEPDLIVLTRLYGEFRNAYPSPADLLLLVEISDSTLGFDLTRKAELYARAGIADYWVLDLPARRLIVHRDPRDGRYRSITGYNDREPVAPLSAPGRKFVVGSAC